MSIKDVAAVLGIVSVAVSIVSVAVTLIISLLKWRSALEEQTRRVSLESATLAWKLANELHENPVASNALELIDGEASKVESPQHGTHDVTDADLRNALTSDPDRPASNEKDAAIRYAFDSMFYALDRLRSAVHTGLVSDHDLSSATIYYCRKLVRTHGFVLDYGMIAYPATVSFIRELGGAPTTTTISRAAA